MREKGPSERMQETAFLLGTIMADTIDQMEIPMSFHLILYHASETFEEWEGSACYSTLCPRAQVQIMESIVKKLKVTLECSSDAPLN